MQTLTFHVSGMHCQACVLLTESELQDISYVACAKTSLSNHCVEVSGDFGDKSQEVVAEELTKILAKHGYSLSVEKQIKDSLIKQSFSIPNPLPQIKAFEQKVLQILQDWKPKR